MDEAEEMLNDADLKDIANEEYYAAKEKLPELEEELKQKYFN